MVEHAYGVNHYKFSILATLFIHTKKKKKIQTFTLLIYMTANHSCSNYV